MRTIREQIARMRHLWPQFAVVVELDWMVRWIGSLRPVQRRYLVEIVYAQKQFIRGGIEVADAYLPRVHLLDPPMKLWHPETGKRVPHIYPPTLLHGPFPLCLYYPDDTQWIARRDPIADTIVPWASEWLACYEGWLATGEWTGGGRHPERREPACRRNNMESQSLDQRESGGFCEVAHRGIGLLARCATSLKPD